MMLVIVIVFSLATLAVTVGTAISGSTVAFAAALMLAVVLAVVVALALEAVDVTYQRPDDWTP